MSAGNWIRRQTSPISQMAMAIALLGAIGPTGHPTGQALAAEAYISSVHNHWRTRTMNGGTRTNAAAQQRAKKKRRNIAKHPRCRG